MNWFLNLSPEFVIAGFLGMTVWALRLEGTIKFLKDALVETQKDVDALRVKQEISDGRVASELKRVAVSLARIEGALGIEQKKD